MTDQTLISVVVPTRNARRPLARRLAIGYGVPVAAAVAATATWFSPGRFFASGDVSPYLRTNAAGEIMHLWNHQLTGAGSTSYAITQALDVVLLAIARMLGASPMAAQHALYALTAGFAALGAAYLAGAWVSHPAARAAAGLLGAFNAFLMVWSPNVLFPLAIGLIGLLAGMVLRAAQGRSVRPLAFAAATLPMSYLGQNPPLLVLTAATVVGTALLGRLLIGPAATTRALILLVRAAPWTVLFNAWWLVPYMYTMIARDAVTVTAAIDALAWTWTHRRASLPNVLTLNAIWAWTFSDYYPYNKRVDVGGGALLRWLPLALAVAGVLLADRARRRPAWSLALATAAAAFLAKGVHPPLGWVNLWLYEHVPGMWLFREPTSKFGVLMVLAYATLAAFAVQRIFDLTVRRPALSVGALRVPHPAGVLSVGLLAVVVAALAYPWPLWTGDVAPRTRGGLPGTRVAVPSDWQRLADKVNADPNAGKLLILPLTSFYQINTSWGFYGANNVPAQLVRRPVLQRLPGGYFGNSSEVESLLSGAENALLAGDVAAAAGPLRILGVSHVVIRHDLMPYPYVPSPADADKIEATLRGVPRVDAVASNSMGTVYRYTGQTGPLQIQQRLLGVTRDAPADVAAAMARLDGGTAAATTPGDLPTAGVDWQTRDASGNMRFTVDRAGSYRITRPTDIVTNYRSAVTVDQSSGGAQLTLVDAQTTRVDGNLLPPRPPLGVLLNRPDPVGLVIDGHAQPLDSGRTVIPVGTGTRVTAYAVAPQWSSVRGDFADVGDCDEMVREKPAQADQQLTRAGSLLSLAATGHRACTQAPVQFVDSRMYRIQLSYRARGGPARVCLWQEVPDRCAEMPALVPGPDWQQYTAVVHAESEAPTLRLFLYADGGPDGATVEYRDVSVAGLEPIGEGVLTAEEAPSVLRDLSAGEHRIDVQSSGSVREGGIPLQECSGSFRGPVVYRPDGSVELSARSGTTCVATPFHTAEAAGVYQLSLDYKTVSGLPPRGWFVQEGPNSSGDLPPLSRTHDWKTLTTTVRVEPGVHDLALYLFADEGAIEPTTVGFRNVQLTRAPTTSVVVSEIGTKRDAPTVSLRAASADTYQARIRGANGPFVLTLAESYASGWRIRGLPRNWQATHFRANGYANGWLISGVGDATITVEYQPRRWIQAAIVLSGGAATVAVFLSILRGIRRRRGPSHVGVHRRRRSRAGDGQKRGVLGLSLRGNA